MGRRSKKDRSSTVSIPSILGSVPAPQPSAGTVSPSAAGHYQPVREDPLPRRAGARLLPLHAAGGLKGLERPAPQPRQPPETIVRRAATTTPTGMSVDDTNELRQQLLEKNQTIETLEAKLRTIEKDTVKALEAKIRQLEKDKDASAAAAASAVATLKAQLQATHEGFLAAEHVITRQEEQIKTLQAQLRGEAPLAEAQEASVGAEKKAKLTTREIAAAHVAQGLLWITPWVTRGERIEQVREMCTAGVRAQLTEVTHQGKQALLTGIVNLREQIETTDNPKEKEALSFFRDFTDEAIRRG